MWCLPCSKLATPAPTPAPAPAPAPESISDVMEALGCTFDSTWLQFDMPGWCRAWPAHQVVWGQQRHQGGRQQLVVHPQQLLPWQAQQASWGQDARLHKLACCRGAVVVPLAACALAAWVAPARVVPGSALQALGAHHIAVLIPGSVAAAILPTRAVAGAVGLRDAAAGSSSCATAGAVLGASREGRLCLLPNSTVVAPIATAAIVTFNMGEFSASGQSCSLPDGKTCAMHVQQQGLINQSSSNKQAACSYNARCQASHFTCAGGQAPALLAVPLTTAGTRRAALPSAREGILDLLPQGPVTAVASRCA